jgi:MFS family permease
MKEMKKTGTFRAFKNRNYTLFFAGQSISQIGTWMQRTAVSWVVYSLTHSAFMLGLAIFAQQFPSFILSLMGGVVADRYSRHKILQITQTASMIQAILLAVLILTNHYVIWEILTLSVILGIVNAFDVPARQPMVHDMVNYKEDLPNALALNSGMVNIARLIGPALSGIVLQKFGAGICFSINAVSFLAVITSLRLMKFATFKKPLVKKKIKHELAEGLVYLEQTREIRIVLILLTTMSFLILTYDTMIPVFAKVIFKGDAATFGYISSFVGLGAIAGSLIMASVKGIDKLKSTLIVSVIVLGAGLILFSRISQFYFALPFAILIGLGSLTPMTASITIIQMEAAPNMRGRVMSFIAMGFFGMLPLGSLLVGFISQKISAPLTMLIQGLTAIVIAIIFSRLLTGQIQEPNLQTKSVSH